MKTTDKPRGLFVNHVPASNRYGAATSFTAMIAELSDYVDVHVLAPAPIDPGRDRGEVLAREVQKYGLDEDHLHLQFLPWDNCYEGAPIDNSSRAALSLRNLLFLLKGRRLQRFIKESHFDFVHLNSLVLNPMTAFHDKCLVHAREVLRPENSIAQRGLSRALGIIAIDGRTREAVDEYVSCEFTTTITNPFDMRHLEERLRAGPALRGVPVSIIPQGVNRVFAIVGTVSPLKGVHTVIEGFVKADMRDAVLLVAGAERDSGYSRLCRETASGRSDILFMGEVEDMEEVYLATDHVVRGDPDFRLGRTVFEGLYAGCGAIIPGSDDEARGDEHLMRFWDDVSCYEPGNAASLSSRLKEAVARPLEGRSFRSNLDEYCDAIMSFLKQVI